jgi:hypothetical protein
MPPNVPVLSASLGDVNHFGTFFVDHAGRYGSAAVSYLQWKLRDEKKHSRYFCNDEAATSNATETKAWTSPLASEGWTVRTKNKMCSL